MQMGNSQKLKIPKTVRQNEECMSFRTKEKSGGRSVGFQRGYEQFTGSQRKLANQFLLDNSEPVRYRNLVNRVLHGFFLSASAYSYML